MSLTDGLSGHDLQIDLDVLLPSRHGPDDRCVANLVAALQATPGVAAVHLATGPHGGPQVCVHAALGAVSIPRLREKAAAAGADIESRYGHALLATAQTAGHVTRADSLGALLRREPGIVDAAVTVDGLVRIEFERAVTDLDRVRVAVGRAGLDVIDSPTLGAGRHVHPAADATGHAHGSGGHEHGGGHRGELVATIGAAAVYFVALVLDWTIESDRLPTVLYIVAAVVTGALVLRDAITSVRARTFEIDLLMFVAAIGAASLGEWSDAALLLVLFCLGHALEGYAMGRARRAIEALAELAPATAHRSETAGVVEVPLEAVLIDDILVIRPNERVPADGLVVVGMSAVDESSVTGESIPVEKEAAADSRWADSLFTAIPAAHRVFAGTLNGSGVLQIRVMRTAGDSTLANVVRLVAEAETQVSPTQQSTRRIVRVFVPCVLALVAVLVVVPPLLGEPFDESFLRAMAVLVAASPCALAIATPSAVLAAISRAARDGVLVKGGGPLEALSRVRTLAFDKTGTLTEGRPRLVAVHPVAPTTERELLSVTLALEESSDHPLARAITAGAREWDPDLPSVTASDVTAATGKGISGIIDGDTVMIGNHALFANLDLPGDLPGELGAAKADLEANGRTTMLVRRGEEWLGVIGVMDAPRPDAADVVRTLSVAGITRMVMLSGDQQAVASAVAASVGISEARGGLLPEDKVDAIRELSRGGGGVAMVGDGVNDAPAMAAANVGIAMGAAGSDVALQTADVALMADRLDRLPFAVRLARRTSRVMRQNLIFSLGVVAVLIPLTLAGVGIGPAVIAHEGSTLVVVANALLLLAFKDRNDVSDN